MKKLFVVLIAMLLSACTPESVKVSDNQTIPDVQNGRSQIVFMRSTAINALVNTTIYDVTTGQPKLVGNIPNGSKVVVDLAPGEYTFMVGNFDHRDFMKATVAANKSYYVVVTAYWPASFSMRAVRHADSEFLYSSSQFGDLVSRTQVVVENPAPVDENARKKNEDFYKQSWEKWQSKTPEQKAILTLHQEDSIR